jgi:actin-related protein
MVLSGHRSARITFAEREIARDIKEKLTYVALDFDAEWQDESTDLYETYILPDAKMIVIGKERFRCPELLFKPHTMGYDFEGIHHAVFDSIMKCDPDLQKDLFANIVISGGSAMFPGLPERLEKEMIELAPPNTNVNVITPLHRRYTAWIGGSIISSWITFPQMAITQEEYSETGPGIVHHKCPSW